MPEKKDTQSNQKKKNNLKSILINSVLITVPALLILSFVFLMQLEKQISSDISSYNLVDKKISQSVSSYPQILNQYPPFITASSAIILDNESQVPLFEKNPDLRFSMASTTKIMTALVALEHYKDTDVLTIVSDDIEGAEVGFKRGERFVFKDVLYGMLLPSGNDAAYALAENYPGGLENFVLKMNEKAKALNLFATHYVDPAGLDDDGNYTTAKDLARLASIALKNPEIKTTVSTKEKTITSTDGVSTYYLENLNKLLGYFGVNGLKTGFTQGAGGVLVTSREENGRTYIIVVIKSEDRFIDTLNLISYMSGNITFFKPAK